MVIEHGGWVVWPLLLLSVLAMTLCIERAWFWMRVNSRAPRQRLARVLHAMRQRQWDAVRDLTANRNSAYDLIAHRLASEPYSDALAADAIDQQRPRIERFMAILSSIITVAPMLGILGTVTGIIASFNVLSQQGRSADLDAISGGIAQALWSTAAGLVVAIVVLFPYNFFRTQVDRTLGRIETLVMTAGGRIELQPDHPRTGIAPVPNPGKASPASATDATAAVPVSPSSTGPATRNR